MGGDSYTSKFFGTEAATGDFPYLEEHIKKTPIGDKEKAKLSIRLENFQYMMVKNIADRINTSHGYVYYAAYSIGLMEFRNHFVDDMELSSDVNQELQDIIEESENSRDHLRVYYSKFSDIDVDDSILRRDGLTEGKKPKVSNSETAEVVKDYAGTMNSGSWIHRVVLAFGLDHQESLRKSQRQDLHDYLDDAYELVLKSIEEYHRRVRSIVTDIVYKEWGVSNIPSAAYDNVLYMWQNVNGLNMDNLETMCELNDGMEMP